MPWRIDDWTPFLSALAVFAALLDASLRLGRRSARRSDDSVLRLQKTLE